MKLMPKMKGRDVKKRKKKDKDLGRDDKLQTKLRFRAFGKKSIREREKRNEKDLSGSDKAEQKDLSSGAKAKDDRLKPRFRACGKISVRNREKTKERKREIKSFPAEIRQRMKTFRVKLNQRMKYSKERWRMLANQEEEGQARFSKLMVECVIVSGVTDN